MGIPFYFASLLRAHKGITQIIKKENPIEVDVLAVDFNSLIHRYLKEDSPVQSVVEAFDYILNNVCKCKTLILALDGLVPYAKIVQQRYRRMRVKEESGTFDRNQISPGTPYMRDLENALAEKYPFAILSRTSEPGEGEHKIVLELKKMPRESRQSICIYGLDADLILISLHNRELSNPYSMYLLRESAEFNDPSLAEAEYSTLSVWGLWKELPIAIEQYLVLSLLCFGNDFMPTIGMFSLREDGYDRALHIYQEAGSPNLLKAAGRRAFLTLAAFKELDFYKERISLRKRPEEKAVFGKDSSLFAKKYRLHVLDGVQDIKPVVDGFWKTFYWTFSYFTKSIPPNWDWVYPYPDAPLVQDMIDHGESSKVPDAELTFTVTQQLSFILPASSLRKAKRRVSYPDEPYTETRKPWMKRHDWEMKPYVSLPWNPTSPLTSVSLLTV